MPGPHARRTSCNCACGVWRILSLSANFLDTGDFVHQSLRSVKFAISIGDILSELCQSLQSAYKNLSGVSAA